MKAQVTPPHAVSAVLIAALLLGLRTGPVARAQVANPPAPNARTSAPIDLTGQWVAVVTEDWRWRMVTPPRGDVASVPLNPAGRRFANEWDLARDRARGDLCKAFGPPGLIRQPGRLRISWAADNELSLHFDAGNQIRRLRFTDVEPVGPRSLQGYSQARWFRQPQSRGILRQGARPVGGSLEIVTTNLRGGYLRPNGVPYSDRATVKEFFDTFSLDEDGTWLIVTTVVEDPVYLTQEFVISSQFRKDSDSSRWNPRPCDIPAPLR